MGEAEAQRALYRLTAILEAEDLPYAIIGAFARSTVGGLQLTPLDVPEELEELLPELSIIQKEGSQKQSVEVYEGIKGLKSALNNMLKELNNLKEKKIESANLFISNKAHIITQQHIEQDQANGKSIGTTGRGIGPAYASKITRTGLRFKEFIKQNRSYSGNLDDYGVNFADFFAEKKDKFLQEIAGFEWLQHKSYLAQDVQLINIEALQNLSAEKLFDVKFKLHPSCFLIDSGYNLLSKKKQSKPQKKQNYFVIYRHDIEVKAERISKGEFNFLSGVKENLSLYQIYEKYKINIQTCLQKYLANSVLSSFSV